MKRIIYLILTILWLSVIFSFSSENGQTSQNTSESFTSSIIIFYEKITKNDVNNDELIDILDPPIRKIAHFTEFFILGLLIFNFTDTFNTSTKRKILYSISFCMLCAIIDETHQLFSIERAPRILDILIDSLGSISIITFINRKNIHIKRRHRN